MLPESCRSCPMYHASRNFALGTGDPTTARIAICLENPYKSEQAADLRHPQNYLFDHAREIEIRARDYRSLPAQFRIKGAAAYGWTGQELEYWVLGKFGLKRADMFVDNVLRCCFAPEDYPTGTKRREAERHCRQYDRWHLFLDDTSRALITIHPAALSRDITPLSLQIADFAKARDMSRTSKVLVLAGGKAAKLFLGYASGVLRWRGHYQNLTISDYNAMRDRQRREALVRVKINLELDNIEKDQARELCAQLEGGDFTAIEALITLSSAQTVTAKTMKPRKPKRNAAPDARQTDMFEP